jgi:hypothetical protein
MCSCEAKYVAQIPATSGIGCLEIGWEGQLPIDRQQNFLNCVLNLFLATAPNKARMINYFASQLLVGLFVWGKK